MYGCWDFFFFHVFRVRFWKIALTSTWWGSFTTDSTHVLENWWKVEKICYELKLESWNIEFIFFCSIFHFSCFFADETFDLVLVLRRLYAKKKMDSEFRFRSFGNIEKIQGKRTQLKIEQLFLPNVQKKMARYMAALVSSITMIIHKTLISKYCDMMLTQKKIALFLHAFKVKISTLTQCIICSSGFH